MKLSTSLLALVLYPTTVLGFAPKATQLKLAVSMMAKKANKPTDWVADDMKKVGKDESESRDWVADAMNEAGKAGLHPDDFVARDMEEAGRAGTPHPREKEKKKDRYEDVTKAMKRTGKATDNWVTRDMEQAGHAGSPSEDAAAMAKKLEHKLDERREHSFDDVIAGMKKAGQEGGVSKDRVAQDMTHAGSSESVLDKLHETNTDQASYKRNDFQKKALDLDEIIEDMTLAGRGPQEWIAADMKKAGAPDPALTRARSAEKTKNELIAEDMMKAGRLGRDNLVARDMQQAGKAESPTEMLDSGHRKIGKAFDDHRKHTYDDVAKDMKKAGRAGSSSDDWVTTDMKIRGKSDTSTASTEKVSSGVTRLGNAIDKQREHDYDDVKEDMEKTGKAGDHSKDWVTQDMENAGRAESLFDKILSAGKDFSYKLSDWQRKAFDMEYLRDEMKAGGRAKPDALIAQDMKDAGKAGSGATTAGNRLPAPKSQLADLTAHDDAWVTADMAELGMAEASPRAWAHQTDNKSPQRQNDLIAEDMKLAGKAQDESVVEDMKMAGTSHFAFGSPDKKVTETQKKRETEVFMKAQNESRKRRQEAVMAAEAAEAATEARMAAEAAMAAQATDNVMAVHAVEDAMATENVMTPEAVEDAMVAESTMAAQAKMAAMAAEDAMAAEAEIVEAARAAAEEKESEQKKKQGFIRHLVRKMATPWRKWSDI
jgi:hypothetical protein